MKNLSKNLNFNFSPPTYKGVITPHPPLSCLKEREKKLNRVKNSQKERENGQAEGRGTHNVPQNIAALQRLKCVA